MEYTGDKKIFVQCQNHLKDEGFSVADAIHLGDDKYEFDEGMFPHKMGCHDTHKILAWIEDGEVKYKAKVTGWYCMD